MFNFLDYKILLLNTKTIQIGGKALSVGDCFNQSDPIKWADEKQAMKVLSLADNKQYIFTAAVFNKNKTKSIKDYWVHSNRLSTRGSGSLSSVARKLGDTIYAIDTTRVAVDYVPDEAEYFFLVRDGERFELPYQDGQLVLSPALWEGDVPTLYDLYFHYSDGEEECVTEELSINPLPKELPKKSRRQRR